MKSSEITYLLRDARKFAASRYISGTPNYIVNGVYITKPSNWKNFLDSLLK